METQKKHYTNFKSKNLLGTETMFWQQLLEFVHIHDSSTKYHCIILRFVQLTSTYLQSKEKVQDFIIHSSVGENIINYDIINEITLNRYTLIIFCVGKQRKYNIPSGFFKWWHFGLVGDGLSVTLIDRGLWIHVLFTQNPAASDTMRNE